MKIEIEITEQEVKDLKAIRNYFGEHDKTLFEHKSYAVVDRLVKKLNIPAVIKSVCYKDCGNTQPSGRSDNICLNCGSSIKQTVL
jgi:hypothetical protein